MIKLAQLGQAQLATRCHGLKCGLSQGVLEDVAPSSHHARRAIKIDNSRINGIKTGTGDQA